MNLILGVSTMRRIAYEMGVLYHRVQLSAIFVSVPRLCVLFFAEYKRTRPLTFFCTAEIAKVDV